MYHIPPFSDCLNQRISSLHISSVVQALIQSPDWRVQRWEVWALPEIRARVLVYGGDFGRRGAAGWALMIWEIGERRCWGVAGLVWLSYVIDKREL